MKWIKERDELIAQTKAFVQSVTGRTSGPASTVSTRPASDANPLSYSVTDRAAPNPAIPPAANAGIASIEDLVSAQPARRGAQPSELRPIEAAERADVRTEIRNRIAAFQAHQHRFHRERDAYFNSVLTKARSATKTEPD